MFYFPGTRKPDFSKIKKINYDDYWKSRGFKLREKLMAREAIFFNWIPQGARVLDIGCGNSRLLLELKEKKGCDVAGIDISPLVIDGLKDLGIKGITADIQGPDFTPEDRYDYIIASEVLEHLSQPEELVSKLLDHAKYFVLSVPNSAFYRYRTGLMFGGRFFTQWAVHPSEHLRYWSHKDFLEWLRAMTLSVIKSKASNGPLLRKLWPNMFGHQICYLAEAGNKL